MAGFHSGWRAYTPANPQRASALASPPHWPLATFPTRPVRAPTARKRFAQGLVRRKNLSVRKRPGKRYSLRPKPQKAFSTFFASPLAHCAGVWYTSDIQPQGSAKGERGLFRKVEAIALSRRVAMKRTITYVNIATAMLLDAFHDKADAFVLVSGDADFVRPVATIRKEFGKLVIVCDPHNRRSELQRYASYYRTIPRDLPAQCQLPDTIPYGKRGDRFIHRPPAWR